MVSLASVPVILAKGGAYYQNYGMGRSRGTLAFQLTGNLQNGGLVEKAFGVTLRELLYDYGGGSASGRPLRAVQVGGPLGAYLPEHQWDVPLDYEAYMKINAMVGHGGLVAFDDTVDMAHMAQYAMEFCAIESCGKCTPCRIGSTRGVETIQKIRRREDMGNHVELLREPGGVELSERLRALVKDPALTVGARAEALIYAAARAQLVEEVIRPRREAGVDQALQGAPGVAVDVADSGLSVRAT